MTENDCHKRIDDRTRVLEVAFAEMRADVKWIRRELQSLRSAVVDRESHRRTIRVAVLSGSFAVSAAAIGSLINTLV